MTQPNANPTWPTQLPPLQIMQFSSIPDFNSSGSSLSWFCSFTAYHKFLQRKISKHAIWRNFLDLSLRNKKGKEKLFLFCLKNVVNLGTISLLLLWLLLLSLLAFPSWLIQIFLLFIFIFCVAFNQTSFNQNWEFKNITFCSFVLICVLLVNSSIFSHLLYPHLDLNLLSF